MTAPKTAFRVGNGKLLTVHEYLTLNIYRGVNCDGSTGGYIIINIVHYTSDPFLIRTVAILRKMNRNSLIKGAAHYIHTSQMQ